jgi:hypothetical protein
MTGTVWLQNDASEKNDSGKVTRLMQVKLYLLLLNIILIKPCPMTRFYLLLFTLFISFTASAQKFAGSGVETNFIYGKIYKHSKKIIAPIPEQSTGFEINYVQQTNGSKDWHHRRRFPLVGFGFMYTDYGIDSIWGKCLAIYPNLQIPIIRGKTLEWTAKLAFGLGYATKRYSRVPTWDTLNTAIGSHFNNFSYFATDVRYHINQHIDIQLGANFSHMSNAALRQPNLGINMYGAHVGLRYFPVTSQTDRVVKEVPALKNRWLIQARAGIAGTELGAADGPFYPVYLGSLYASKRYRSKNKVFAGVDYSYHQNIYAFLRNNEIAVGEERAKSWKSAVFAGHEFLFGRVGIMLQAGVYIKQAELTKKDKYYQKLGANVYLLQNEKGLLKELFASCLLKTHTAQAELVEVGIGAGF